MASASGSSSEARSRPRLLVVGAGVAAQSLVREIAGNDLPVIPVGFLDDDASLSGKQICGLPVLGGTEDLVDAAAAVAAEEILLAIPSAPGRLVRRLVILSRRAGLPFRIVPGLRDIILGDVAFAQVRSVAPDDLLGRESVDFAEDSAASFVNGRQVMVTGAGGSIGGELCRQLIRLQPKNLILLGRGENSLFEIENELRNAFPEADLTTVVADVRDQRRMTAVARRLGPDLILHAAAHKHVPLMETNPEEAVLVNVQGTANMISFARQVGAERFVLVSTDKAVAPTSVMGATKKLAEILVRQAAVDTPDLQFLTVRFGNVLGSRGSVVPYFQKRIEAGLPLTVTDPRMTRYFMTIKEAAQLVIEALVMGEGGATYILEMGNPVSILELATNLLILSGYDPNDGSDGPGIRITGMRPGEKLNEALHEETEEIRDSTNPLIRKAVLTGPAPNVNAADITELLQLAEAGDAVGLRQRLAALLQQPELATGPQLGHPRREKS